MGCSRRESVNPWRPSRTYFPQGRLWTTSGTSPDCRVGGACFSLPSNHRQMSEELRTLGGLLSQAICTPYGRVSKTVAAFSSGWLVSVCEMAPAWVFARGAARHHLCNSRPRVRRTGSCAGPAPWDAVAERYASRAPSSGSDSHRREPEVL